MSSLWKAIGLGGGKELNYDIGDPIPISDEYKYRFNWQINKGYHKVRPLPTALNPQTSTTLHMPQQ